MLGFEKLDLKNAGRSIIMKAGMHIKYHVGVAPSAGVTQFLVLCLTECVNDKLLSCSNDGNDRSY